jgi:hypothetical protein
MSPRQLSNQGAGSCRLIFPVRWEFLGALIIAGKAVNTALNENKPELRVLILAVSLQMLAHSHSLLDQMIQILRDLRS